MPTSTMFLNYLLQDIKASFELLAEIDEDYVFDNSGHFRTEPKEEILFFVNCNWGWTVSIEDDESERQW